MFSIIFNVAMLATCAGASPLLKPLFLDKRAAGDTAASQILAIAPSSSTCAGAAFPDECSNATNAGPHLVAAMETYSITSLPEMSALISLMAYESGEFKYNANHYPAPGRPGQGTRNMQMSNYNLMYAQSIPALSSSLSAVTTATSTTGLSDDELNSILALVQPDEYSFASAAWFLTTQCDASVRTALQTGGQTGYETYLTSCVGTTATSDRLAYWTTANTALGIS